MDIKKLILFYMMACVYTAGAQQFSIRGQVTDSTFSPLDAATIILLSPKDSSLVNFSPSDVGGHFELKNITRSNYLLSITHIGFKTHTITIHPPSSQILDLGLIQMEIASTKLDEVIIKAEPAPVVIKKDTIEFNASSFKTNPNATVEDLLKKLPGVEVDHTGKITAQGEDVKRIMVDGKDFFGGRDPKIATKNLPADAIDKIQVFDRMSDQSVFTGIDDGQREKSINLELRPEKRNAAFGLLTGGGGRDERYLGKVNINRFWKSRQLSFIGMANNVNEQGFSTEDYMNFTRSTQPMGGAFARSPGNVGNTATTIPINTGGRPNGFMTTVAGGVHLNETLSKKTELNSSYFYNHLDQDIKSELHRTNYFANGNLILNKTSTQASTNSNHRASVALEHKIDSSNSLKLTSSLNYTGTHYDVKSRSENVNENDELQNTSDNSTVTWGNNTDFNTDLLYGHRFHKPGRTFSVNGTIALGRNETQWRVGAENNFYIDEELNTSETIVQDNQSLTMNTGYGVSISYTEPLGRRVYLETNYRFNESSNDVHQAIYDIENDVGIFNDSLSSEYSSNYIYHRPGINLKINRNQFNLTAGLSSQYTDLRGQLISVDERIGKTFQNVLPAIRFNYDFSSSKHLNLIYQTNVQEPTIQQLQPTVDNRDQLNLYVGNPDLSPSYAHQWRLNFNTFSPATYIVFFGSINVTYTSNPIVDAQSTTEQHRRLTMPVNVDNSTSFRTNATFSFPLAGPESRFILAANADRLQSINLLNDAETEIIRQVLAGSIRYNYRYREVLDFSIRAKLEQQTTSYEFSEAADQAFLNETYSSEFNWTFLKNVQLTSTFDFLVYENQTTTAESLSFFNVSFSFFMLKAKSGELKLSANNLLNESISLNQQADVNYFEQEQITSLGRYFMLSFTYSLNKQLNPLAGRERNGMRRMPRRVE